MRQISWALRLPGLLTKSVIAGAVASYLTTTLATPWLPARSRQEPPMNAVAASGPA
jgi:hypothetical protein